MTGAAYLPVKNSNQWAFIQFSCQSHCPRIIMIISMNALKFSSSKAAPSHIVK